MDRRHDAVRHHVRRPVQRRVEGSSETDPSHKIPDRLGWRRKRRGRHIRIILQRDPNDAESSDDPAILGYRAYFAKYLPGADIGDTTYLNGTQQGEILEQLLKQCGTDLSRENISRQAHNLKDVTLPTFLEGVRINTTATNVQAITQLRLLGPADGLGIRAQPSRPA
jgi:hypothetical protein